MSNVYETKQTYTGTKVTPVIAETPLSFVDVSIEIIDQEQMIDSPRLAVNDKQENHDDKAMEIEQP